ncbi:ComF family protein [Thalassotalea euphylliae]|uniref:ComF family protein n=1 Tax=Thalassotalea euphylliae TaxID=1655234 RepID=UPI0036258B42
MEFIKAQDALKHWQERILLAGKAIKSIAFQQSCCPLCDLPTESTQVICRYCLTTVPMFDMKKLGGDLLNRPEIHKLYQGAHFSHLISVMPYQYPVKQWLGKYKYHRQLYYQYALSELLLTQLKNIKQLNFMVKPDVVIPVPSHIRKWRKRGFNQTIAFGESVARFFNAPMRVDVVKRVKLSKDQVNQSGRERRKQLKNAFQVCQGIDLSSQTIWLIDDVITTGTTANEISRQLRAAGAQSIILCTLAISV